MSGLPSRLMSATAQVSYAPGSIMWRANGISAGRDAAHAAIPAASTAAPAHALSLLIFPSKTSDPKDNLKKRHVTRISCAVFPTRRGICSQKLTRVCYLPAGEPHED